MKIYFAGSITSGRENIEIYVELIKHLKKYGEVLTQHIGDKKITSQGETNLSAEEIHNRDISWLKDSDILVAEISIASLGIGYEIGRSVENNKKILCLFKSKKDQSLSKMITGSKKVTTKEYNTINEAKEIIDEYFNKTF